MKRIFENPEISVKMFLTENIITTSGTYAQKVKKTMGVDEKNLTTSTFNDIFG